MAQHPKRIDYMAKRQEQGLKHHELGEEFGMSRQHVGRLLGRRKKDKSDQEV